MPNNMRDRRLPAHDVVSLLVLRERIQESGVDEGDQADERGRERVVRQERRLDGRAHALRVEVAHHQPKVEEEAEHEEGRRAAEADVESVEQRRPRVELRHGEWLHQVVVLAARRDAVRASRALRPLVKHVEDPRLQVGREGHVGRQLRLLEDLEHPSERMRREEDAVHVPLVRQLHWHASGVAADAREVAARGVEVGVVLDVLERVGDADPYGEEKQLLAQPGGGPRPLVGAVGEVVCLKARGA
mmetsp:Transcript_35175/g.87619  ORF Transcript_35175/g.87619 Transcript_35175/m.87619 type:complete len:245 (+) Transcript_35175:2601-3335(+)